MRSITSKTTRWRLRAARSWWLLGLVAANVGLLLGANCCDGAIATVCAASCILGMVVLWMVVSIRRGGVDEDVFIDADADDVPDDSE